MVQLIQHKNSYRIVLTNKKKVANFFKEKRPEFVIMCAAKVGGILENKNYELDWEKYQNKLVLTSSEGLVINEIKRDFSEE